MSRAHFYRPIQDSEGNLMPDTLVRVIDEATELSYEGDLFVSEEGSEVRENPYTSETGIVEFYLASPTKIALALTPPGGEEIQVNNLSVGTPEARETFSFSSSGLQAVKAYGTPYYLEDPYQILSVRLGVGVAPEGADIIVDINKNGTSIFASQVDRPRILDGEITGFFLSEGLTIEAGDYLTIDVDQIGSSYAGTDLSVQVRARRTSS